MASNGGIAAEWTEYKGRKVKLPKLKGSQSVKTLRETSFSVRGAKIFNSLPLMVRNYGGAGATLEEFKTILGEYLNRVPGRPRDVSTGWLPAPVDPVTGSKSNSLIHWRNLLNKSNPEYEWY